MNQINTNKYNDYNILDQCFQDDGTYKIASNKIVTCERIFQRQHLTMKTMLVTLCKNTSERYHFNILIFINILYHIYVESELYQLAYGRGQNYHLQG